MTTFNKTFASLYDVGAGELFAIGDSNDHTFVVSVSNVDTSVDFNLQLTLDGVIWVDLESSDVQKTGNGDF